MNMQPLFVILFSGLLTGNYALQGALGAAPRANGRASTASAIRARAGWSCLSPCATFPPSEGSKIRYINMRGNRSLWPKSGSPAPPPRKPIG